MLAGSLAWTGRKRNWTEGKPVDFAASAGAADGLTHLRAKGASFETTRWWLIREHGGRKSENIAVASSHTKQTFHGDYSVTLRRNCSHSMEEYHAGIAGLDWKEERLHGRELTRQQMMPALTR